MKASASRRAGFSRFLSRALRHDPASVGLDLDPRGWAGVDEVLAAFARSGAPVSEEDLQAIVIEDRKGRFELNPDGRRIRASYGHSVPVDLGLTPQDPPFLLFHGTARSSVAAILERGIEPRGRRLVHLSEDTDTARAVGRRHGPPCVLVVEAQRLAATGHEFFRTAGGTWLTQFVPAGFVREA